MNERWIFVGTGAHVGRVDSEYSCGFWADNPLDPTVRFDPGLLVPVDLRRSPSYVAAPGDVVVDDFVTDGGLTGVGPGFPTGGFLGAIWLEEGYWAKLPPAIKPRIPPSGSSAYDYEYKTVLYWPSSADPRAGRRYVGTYAKIVGAAKGTDTYEVDVWSPGTSATGKPAARLIVDLSSIDYCDPEAMGGLTTLGAKTPAGALYLERSVATRQKLLEPKLPWWKGE